MSDSADLFYPASSGEQSSTRDGHTSEKVDQGHSSESVTSDNYYTPEEEGQFLPDFVVSLSCFSRRFSLQASFKIMSNKSLSGGP